MKHAWLCGLLTVAACRFGEPTGSPTDLVEPPDAGADAALAEDEPAPPGNSDVPNNITPARETDGSSAMGSDAGDSFPTFSADGAVADLSCAPTVTGCDPVRGTGCLPLTQCVVDTGLTQPAGRCVFSTGPSPDASVPACDETALSTSCPSQRTCVNSVCRKYCYCDSDCEGTERCTDTSGPGLVGVFKLCAAAR